MRIATEIDGTAGHGRHGQHTRVELSRRDHFALLAKLDHLDQSRMANRVEMVAGNDGCGPERPLQAELPENLAPGRGDLLRRIEHVL